ncbi:putative protein C03B1.10, partial [Ophiophagus hannah]
MEKVHNCDPEILERWGRLSTENPTEGWDQIQEELSVEWIDRWADGWMEGRIDGWRRKEGREGGRRRMEEGREGREGGRKKNGGRLE